jgi:hypothetical protein
MVGVVVRRICLVNGFGFWYIWRLPARRAMRRLTIVAVFLTILLAGCGANTTTESMREATGDTTGRSAQPETTVRIAAVPEKAAPATVRPRAG